MADLRPRYGKAALAYLEAGWIPIPATPQKVPMVKAATGHAPVPDKEQVKAWIAEHPNAETSIRLPQGYFALDIDAYKGDLEKLGELEKEFGRLPSTWSSDARGGKGGKRIYRMPKGYEDSKIISHIKGITTIQHTHRHLMVFPSFHPEVGAPVLWYLPNGEVSCDTNYTWIPDLDDIPRVSEKFAQELTQRAQWQDYLNVDAPPISPEQISKNLIHANDKCNRIVDLAKTWSIKIAREDNFHDLVKEAITSLYHEASNGHGRLDQAINIIYEQATKLKRGRDLVTEFHEILGWFDGRFKLKEDIEDECHCNEVYKLHFIRQKDRSDVLDYNEVPDRLNRLIDFVEDNYICETNAVIGILSVDNGVKAKAMRCRTWSCRACNGKNIGKAMREVAFQLDFNLDTQVYFIWDLNEKDHQTVVRKCNDASNKPLFGVTYKNAQNKKLYGYVYAKNKTINKTLKLVKTSLYRIFNKLILLRDRITRLSYERAPKKDHGNYVFSMREYVRDPADQQYYESLSRACFVKLMKDKFGKEIYDKLKRYEITQKQANAELGIVFERMVREELGQQESFWLREEPSAVVKLDNQTKHKLMPREFYANRVQHLPDAVWSIIQVITNRHKFDKTISNDDLNYAIKNVVSDLSKKELREAYSHDKNLPSYKRNIAVQNVIESPQIKSLLYGDVSILVDAKAIAKEGDGWRIIDHE